MLSLCFSRRFFEQHVMACKQQHLCQFFSALIGCLCAALVRQVQSDDLGDRPRISCRLARTVVAARGRWGVRAMLRKCMVSSDRQALAAIVAAILQGSKRKRPRLGRRGLQVAICYQRITEAVPVPSGAADLLGPAWRFLPAG